MGQVQPTRSPARSSFLRSLLRDSTANTIVIAAATMIPLMAMVGGGVDASRYYMAAARLQAACDAGALAARRAMLTDNFTSEHNQIANNFFDYNFNDTLYGTTNRTRSFTGNDSGMVVGTAAVQMPMTIMSAFGFEHFDISVECSADINISNTDIMFVLDTTGSMGATDAGGGLSRIQALRNAVMNFYDTVRTSTAGTAQVRFGAVPYSQNVNVGGLLLPEYLVDSHTYQSRVPNFTTNFTPGNGVVPGDEIVISDQTEWLPRDTSDFGSSNTNDYRFRNSGSSQRAEAENFCWNILPATYTVGDETWQVFAGTEYVTGQWSGGSGNNRAGCRGRLRKTKIATAADVIEDTTVTTFDDYTYQRVTIDVTPFKTGGTISLPTGVEGAMQTHSWNGCIEEADTVNQATFNPIPANAFDLDINLVPATDAQRWKPSLPTASWRRIRLGAGNGRNFDPWNSTREDMPRSSQFCPSPAFRLADITRAQLQIFVDGLTPQGNTYHDIGMVWGARLISPNGMFAADNNTAPNGDPIARHIVFMTDGVLQPHIDVYSAYGYEWWDRRVTTDGNNARLLERHGARFQAVCRAAKAENVSVWVVAFGTPLTPALTDCASPGRAFQANNSAQLEAAFQEIAQKIAALRLTQ